MYYTSSVFSINIGFGAVERKAKNKLNRQKNDKWPKKPICFLCSNHAGMQRQLQKREQTNQVCQSGAGE